MKTNSKKALALFISFVCSVMSFSVGFADTLEANDYAEIVFGKTNKTTNAAVMTTFPVVNAGGREGVKSNVAGGNYYISVDVADDFMYDVPEGAVVDVTIEYYDSGNGFWTITYDTYESIIANNNSMFDLGERVDNTNSGEWKSHTFRLKDFKATNGIGGYDIRIDLWHYIDLKSPDDVIFGSVKVERVPMPVSAITSGHIGNQFAMDDKVAFDIKHTNYTDEDAKLEYAYKVLNDENEAVHTGSGSREIKAGETATDSEEIVVPVALKNGVYTIEADLKYTMKSGKEFTDSIAENFSVSYIFAPGENNDEIGTTFQLAENQRGVPEKVGENLARAGLSILRDGINASNATYSGGKYTITDETIDRWKRYKEASGGDLLVLLSHPGNGKSGMPDTPERYAEYAQFCYDAVTQLKGITNYFEIWNEPNITFGNPAMAPPESYAEMSKAAYKRIKEANPDAFVMIGSTASSGSQENCLDVEFHERIFEAGALEYADAVSVHPYDWSGNFNERRFIKGMTNLRELMNKYGGENKEIWITEYGFSSNPGGGGGHGYTELEQAQNYTLSYNIMKAYNLLDRCIFYALYDAFSETNVEHNWGWFAFETYTKDRPRTASSAKKVFVAMTAASKFIGEDAVVKDIINVENTYASHYFNSKLNKDVLMLQTSAGSHEISIKLGAQSAELYDLYGNKLETINSDNGIYTLVAGRDPIYLAGSFASFELSGEKAQVYCDSTEKDGAKGDSVYFNFVNRSGKDLGIAIDGAEVIENKGFVNGEAVVKIRVPQEGESTTFNITVKDTEGNAYYSGKHKINIKPPIDVTLTSEQADKDSASRWRLRAVVKNMANDNKVSGTIKITSPEDVAKSNITRSFVNLEPQREITFLFNIPKKINKTVVDAVATVELTNGFSAAFENSTCFSAALYAKSKPIIDGDIDVGEWNGSWIGADSADDYYKILTDWEGPEDLSFSGTMMWDEEAFYFMAIVTDDIYFVNHTPGGISNTYNGDGLQIGLDDRATINPVEDASFCEINIANVPGIGDIAYLQKSLYADNKDNRLLENAEIFVKRRNNYTIYECKLPWDEVFYKGYVVRPDDPFRFSVLVNDNDATGRKGFLEYTAGIGRSKSASQFGEMKFHK